MESGVVEPETEPVPAGPAPVEPAKVSRQQGRKVDYDEAAKRLTRRCVDDARNNQPRLDRDRQDWQNLLLYRGGRDNHWSVFDHNSNSYVPRGNDPERGGLPEWVPRPVTNIFATVVDGIISILNQSEPAKLFSPATDDDEDRATAEVAEDADPVLLDEIGYASLRPQLHKLITLTNGAALVLYFDNNEKYGTQDIPLLRCPSCGLETLPARLEEAGNVCPDEQCPGDPAQPGQPVSGDRFEPVIDGQGVPQGVPFAKGKICAKLIPSFEYSLPTSARVADAKENPWVLTHSEEAKEDVIARWKKAAAIIDRSGSRKGGGIQHAYARGMRSLSSPIRASQSAMGASKASGPVVYRLHHDPIDDDDFYFPDGLHAIMIDDEIMESGPLPLIDDEDRAVKSVLIRSFSHAPGCAFGKPPGDDLVPLQISRNLVDSLIQLILMHDAAPRTFIPLSVTLENQPTGRPGESIFYRSMMPGEKPQTDRGISPPEGLYKYLEIIDAKFQEVSKLNSVLAGSRPEGEPTLGEVQRLEENGMRSFNEPLDQLTRFERELSMMLFWFAKQSGWADRMRRVRGENGQWEIRQFNASNLTGKIDIQIDKQSAWPKSPLARLLRLAKAFEWGVLPPPGQDPELQQKMLLELDLIQMKPSMDADRKQVARKLDRWKAAHDPSEIAPPNPDAEELPLHRHFIRQFFKTEEFEQLTDANPPLAQAMFQHLQQIEMVLQQQAMAQAAMQAGPPPPDNRTAAEKGDGSAVQDAVSSGALRPAGGEPAPPDELQGAIASGALRPAGGEPAPPDPMQLAIDGGALMPAEAMPQPQLPSIDDLMAQGVLAPAPQEPPV